MEAHDTQGDGFSQSEVIAALLDLARLSYHFASATSQTPGALATMLLERLLAICEAKRGALLCTTHSPTGVMPAVVVPPPSSKIFRTLALHGLSEEKAQALVMAISADDGVAPRFIEGVQSPPGEPCWLISHLSISGYLHPRQVTLAQQQDHRAEPPIAGQPKPFFLSLYTFLVLGWEEDDKRACIAATKKGQTVLPFVTDAAGSALMNILLVEHIAELEALADRKALREMELLKAELLATVSHELRSPLASIKGYAATLLRHERRILREERHEFLLAITQASDRLEAVIDRLLEISRLETGSITIERSSVDLAYLIREAIIVVERRFVALEHEANAPETPMRYTFTLHLQDHLGMPTRDEPIIQADRNLLREVLDNLLENAIIYSPEGGAIEVVVRPLVASGQAVRSSMMPGYYDDAKKAGMPSSASGSGQMVEICVRDTGIGIPPEHLERVFDRFHRVDTRLTREVNGLGLGLSICRRIVELHGGVIWAESEIGTGSALHVWLPTGVIN